MSVQTSRVLGTRQKKSGLGSTGLPQVNLLPPEVRAARSLAVVKRWLVVAVLVTLTVVALVYVFALLVRGSAEDRLAAAESQTVTLRAEERTYAEVPQVRGAIDEVTRARLAGTATEIIWRPYLDAVTAALPDSVRIVSFSATGPSPTLGAQQALSPLDAPSIASLSIEGQSLTLPDTSAMLDALENVPGLQDPWVSAIAATEINGVTFHTFSLTVQLADSTLAERFVETPEEN